MGDFNAAAPPKLRFLPSPGPTVPVGAPWPRRASGPHLLVNMEGRCVYASGALAALLQCGLHELYGDGWRTRISPWADRPFNAERAIELCERRIPIRLHIPGGRMEIVSRIRTVTDPHHAGTVTGFFGRVQVVRVHQREERTA